jgi:hypothetical protein
MIAAIPIERSQITSAIANAIRVPLSLEKIFSTDALMPLKTGWITRGSMAGAIEFFHVLRSPSFPSRASARSASGMSATSARNAIADA